MRQKELKTPFGTVDLFKNGERIDLEVMPLSCGMYLDDDTFKRPQGGAVIYPNMNELAKGDIIVCEFDGGDLQDDGGGEFMFNIVGVYQGYTIGMGAPDSEDIERHHTRQGRVLPYETLGSTGRGFKVHIIDDPKKYPCEREHQRLRFIAAWEPGAADEAWELISFVTC